MPKAVLEFHKKDIFPDGSIVEIKIWRLPVTDSERPHGWKYSLFFGRSGERLVAYDNERGKGDHRHRGPFEEPYVFTTLERLILDFRVDVERMRRAP
ncbi:MAG: toxin-antitoxin system TumE family protein [Alsobacter sp.]|jgi:hypothetical protein